jgi:hypothetical protein
MVKLTKHDLHGYGSAVARKMEAIDFCMGFIQQAQEAIMDCGDRPDHRMRAIFELEAIRRGLCTHYLRDEKALWIEAEAQEKRRSASE